MDQPASPTPSQAPSAPARRPYNPALRGDSLFALRTAQTHLKVIHFDLKDAPETVDPEDGYTYHTLSVPEWIHETVADLLIKAYEMGQENRPFNIID